MKCTSKTIIFSVSVLISCLTLVFFTGQYKFPRDEGYLVVNVDPREIVFETDPNFLSVALDMSFMKCLFHKLNESAWERLKEMTSFLSPGYFRLGGTAADQVVYKRTNLNRTLGETYGECSGVLWDTDVLEITDSDWIKINNFVKKTNLKFIFNLNVLLRSPSGWNSTNAQLLLRDSEKKAFTMDFQLGNEPNSFPHVFNITVSGSQLAMDFDLLKSLLNSSQAYKNSKLIGPDVTRPKHLGTPSLEYLREFLSNTKNVDAASWHQYYMNGRTAELEDFLDPGTFDVFPHQVTAVKQTVREFSAHLPIWISETSSAYGGGAPGLSDRFAASFLWLDKLGVSAKLGMSIVIRQSLFQGAYALIDDELFPNPDFWLSVLFKKLIGTRVLRVIYNKENSTEFDRLRFYSHCSVWSQTNFGKNATNAIVVYALNFSNKTEKVVISGFDIRYPIDSFVLTPESDSLTTRSVLLNGVKLKYSKSAVENILEQRQRVKYPLVLPKYSLAFWVFQSARAEVCG